MLQCDCLTESSVQRKLCLVARLMEFAAGLMVRSFGQATFFEGLGGGDFHSAEVL